MNMQTAWRRQRARDRASVERYAEEIMVDTRWDWLRSRRRRRAIVIAFSATLIATAALYITVGPWGFLALVMSIALWIGLRLAVRTVADLPDELLDERLIMLRDGAYRSAFMALGTLLLVTLGGVLCWVLFTTRDGAATELAIDDNDAFGVFWASVGFCVALPSMALAWAEDTL